MATEKQILDVLSQIIDPDFQRDIVSLGFVQNVKIDGAKVAFEIELTTSACPLSPVFKKQAEDLVRALPGVASVLVTSGADKVKTAEMLYEKLKDVQSGTSGPFSLERCRELAPLVDEINRLKKEKNAVILAHSYVHPEIIYGVADFVGDSYQLSKNAKAVSADLIIFVAVRFMAETAKALNPGKEVRIPSRLNGCSLADSITGDDVRRLRKENPGFTFVCYINTSAEVKAECDVCVTSSNVYDIVERIPSDKIYFLPDKLMGENVQDELKRRGVNKEILLYDGNCYVHAEYDAERVGRLRKQHPDMKILSHPECSRDIIEKSDFVGSTTGLMDYMREDESGNAYLLLTECGLAGRAQVEMPGKTFIGPCFECKYMKSNSLEDIRRVLVKPEAEDIIEISDEVREGSLRCIDAMFYYAEKK